MPKPTSQNRFINLLAGLLALLIICSYSCNNATPKEEKKDSTAMMPKDTTMKVVADSAKSDTSGKGTQTPPPGH